MEPYNAVISAASEAAPHLYGVSVRAVQYQSIGEIIGAVFILALGAGMIWMSIRTFRLTLLPENIYNHDKRELLTLSAIITGLTGAVAVGLGLFNLFSVRPYVGLVDPEARMLREIVKMCFR